MKNSLRSKSAIKLSVCLVVALSITTRSKAQESNWSDTMLSTRAEFQSVKQSFYNNWNGYSYIKGHGWKQFHRWESFWETRLLTNGKFPNFKQAYKEFKKYESDNGYAKVAGGNWSPIGPTTYNNTQSWSPGLGRVNFIVEDPNNANILYVGAPAGGIWKSTNAGSTWTALGDDLAVMGISSIGISASNSNVIYLATGDADGGDTYSIGVMKSVDAGLTWAEVGNVNGNLRDIIVDPTNADIAYVCSNAGVLKTTNGGTSWTNVLGGSFRDLEFKPGTSTTVYAATSNEVHYSTNSGGTWTQSTGVPTGGDRIAMAVTPANSAYVYILVADNTGGYDGIYRSTNSGSSFSPRNTTTDVFEGSTQSWYDMAIGVSATNANTIFTGCLNVWKSTNGGSSLTQLNSWSNPGGASYTHADIHFLRGYGGNFYCGSDGGVYRSTNNGSSFTDLTDGIQIGQFYKIAGSPSDVTTVAGGLQDNGGYLLNSGIWKVYYGADGMEAAVDPANSNRVFGMIQYGDLYRTTNGGNNLQGLGSPESGRWVTPMQHDPNVTQRIVAGYNDLYEYTTGWNQLSTFNFPALLRNIEIYEGNSNVMYVSTNDRIYRTTNNGTAFTEVTNGLTAILSGNIITSIEVDPADQNRVWVSISGWTAGNKVAYTANGGTTWTNVSGSLPNLPCNVVKFESTAAATNALYVGMDIGAYYRDDVLGDFMPFMVNLPNVIVNDLEINEAAGVVRAGTYGRGVWESGVYGVQVFLDDAGIASIDNPTGSFCGDTFTPEVTLRNYGSNTLTQVDINYQVNAGPISTYSWIGSLGSFTSQQVVLPSAMANGASTFTVWTSSPNGVADTNTPNDTMSSNFSAVVNGVNVYSQLIEDCWGSEVSWEIQDGLGATLLAGGPYSDGNALNVNTDSVCLEVACYDFIINDSYGDGMFGSQYGSCNDDGDYYVITEFNDTLVAMGGDPDFGTDTTHNFCVPSQDFADFTWGGGAFCQGDTVTFTDISVGATTWTWNFGAGATPATAIGAGPHNVTYATGGSSTVLLTINGGTLSSSQSLTIHPTPVTPTVSASGATTFCDGASVNLTSSETGGNVWSTLVTTNMITASTNGPYSVTHTDANGCSATSTPIIITVNANPTISTGTITDPTACSTATGTIQITGSGAGDLSWSGTASGSSNGVSLPNTLTSFGAGFYNVIFTDGNGCISNSVAAPFTDPTPPPTPTISAGGPITFCEGGSVVLTSSAATGNVWSGAEMTQAITVNSSGNYGVTVTVAGCAATSLPITVLVNPNPIDPIISVDGPLTICDGDTVELTSSYATGNDWSNLATTDMIEVTSAGSYSVTYTDGNGCTASSAAVNLIVNALPAVSAGPDQEVCAGAVVTLSGSGAGSYTWDNGALDGIGFNPLVGTVTYTVTGTDSNGCVATDQMVLIAHELPTVIMSSQYDTLCESAGMVTLTGAPAGGTFSGIGVSGGLFDPSVSGAGSFNVSYDYTDVNNCSANATIQIVVQDCSSIDEWVFDDLEVYPNPTNGIFGITLDSEFEYVIHDARGRLVRTGTAVGEVEIDASLYDAGLYMLTITNERNTQTVRLVRK